MDFKNCDDAIIMTTRNITIPTISELVDAKRRKLIENKHIITKRTIFGSKTWILSLGDDQPFDKHSKWRRNSAFICFILILTIMLSFAIFSIMEASDLIQFSHEINNKTSTIEPNDIQIYKDAQTRKAINGMNFGSTNNFTTKLHISKTNNVDDLKRLRADDVSLLTHKKTRTNETHKNDIAKGNVYNDATYFCRDCDVDSVCLILPREPLATCKKVIDSRDPTGCGGICVIGEQYCRLLSKIHKVYQCVEAEKTKFCPKEKPYRCQDLCLNENKLCDGIVNCFDRSDEMNCTCNKTTHFQCTNNTSCFPISKKCNGAVDCWDGSDELNCIHDCDSKVRFPCSDGRGCIEIEKFCNSNVDCNDGSDEPLGCE